MDDLTRDALTWLAVGLILADAAVDVLRPRWRLLRAALLTVAVAATTVAAFF